MQAMASPSQLLHHTPGILLCLAREVSGKFLLQGSMSLVTDGNALFDKIDSYFSDKESKFCIFISVHASIFEPLPLT